MKKSLLLFSVAMSAMLLAASSAQAVRLNIGTVGVVSPLNNSFTFDIIGYGSGNSGVFYDVPPETAVFGTTGNTNTYNGAGVDGQTITLKTTETVNAVAGTTTDTFTVSTPTNFLTDSVINGTTITALQFDLGDSNSGSPAVSVVGNISSYTATGSMGGIYMGMTYSNSLPLITTYISNGGSSYGSAEGVSTGSTGNPVSGDGVNSFTYSITYSTTVPEPSTWAMLGLGVAGVAVTLYRRRVTA
jgi:hypothetical protein